LFAILLPDDIQNSNALKGLLGMVNGLPSFISRLRPGLWAPGLLMGVGSLSGASWVSVCAPAGASVVATRYGAYGIVAIVLLVT
jgi:hypothetical protein